MDPLISAILDAVFAALADSVGLSDWLRQRLKGDPEKLAFRAALTEALTAAAAQFPGRDVRYFAEVLPQIGGPLLARYLQPAAPLPTGAELTQLWLNHLTIDSTIHYRQDFEQFATFLLDQLDQQIENQQPLQWIVQARRQRSSEEATQRLAEAAVQSAATLDALRQDVSQLTAALETALKANHSTVTTAGGAYVAGNVSAQNFAGRDLTIKNYFVAGLARLVIDYGPRIQDFLLEYLGSKRKRVPFGGRQAQLDELHAWLDDPVAPPYYLMTAEAGRGKSALVCRWLAQLTTRPDLDVIFMPISLRFETATQDVVFAALATRLANLYESEPEKLPPASLTAEQWKGVCQSYLRRSPPEGKQLLVILDGLDEATGWTPGRGLFSADPPPGLRVLVTARTRPGETGSSGWAATLGWDNAQLARTATLPGLQRRGVEEALISMGNPLDHLATKVDVVGELHRLSEGDPLLVRLYVDALLAQGPAVAMLRAEDLQHIQPGLAGYFERWWQDQQEQWRIQGRDPIVEQAQLRLLLNAIAAALGPLLLDDLAALHPDLADGMLVRRLLQQVSRWLVGDGKTQGYSYSHPRLGYYFWEQLGSREQRVWDERFCAWGERVLVELNARTLAPAAAPPYLLQHYASHLERHVAPPARLYALISDGWRKAWEWLDVSYAGFLRDVDRAWERAKQGYDANQPGRAVALTQQIKAGLCRASVSALGDNMPPALLAQLVATGLRTPIQALTMVKLVPDQFNQAKTLAMLVGHLPAWLLAEALDVIRAIQYERPRADALIALAPHLPVSLLAEALGIIRAMESDDNAWARALGALAPHLPASLLIEALGITRTMKNELSRARALGALAPHLPVSLLAEALGIIRAMESDDNAWARALGALAPHLPSEERSQVLIEALDVIRAIRYERPRADALIALAPHLPVSLLAEALGIIRAMESDDDRARALGALAPHLPSEERSQALIETLGITRTMKNELSRADALIALAPHLPASLLAEALDVIRAMRRDATRARALGGFAPHLPASLLVEALGIIRAMRDNDDRIAALRTLASNLPMSFLRLMWDDDTRADALIALAPYLPVSLLAEALDIIRAMWSDKHQANLLVALAPHLPTSLLAEAWDVARTMGDSARARTLVALAPHLPSEERSQVLIEALGVARTMKNDDARAIVLVALAPHLPVSLLAEALGIIRAMESDDDRARALGGFAPYLPKLLLIETLGIIRAIRDDDARARALGTLAPHLPALLLVEALCVTRTMKNDNARAVMLDALAPHLPVSLLAEAWDVARTMKNDDVRADALVALAPYLPASLLAEAWGVARTVEDYEAHARALGGLTPYLPTEERLQGLAEVLRIQDDDARANVLVALAPDLPVPLLAEVLGFARSIGDNYNRARALGALARYLPEEERTQVFVEALGFAGITEYKKKRTQASVITWDGSDSAMEYENGRASVLIALAPHLPLSLLAEAWDVARTMEGTNCAYVLNAFAPHLPASLLAEAWGVAWAMKYSNDRAFTLGSLAPYLSKEECGQRLVELLEIFSQELDELLGVTQLVLDKNEHAWMLGALAKGLSVCAAQQPQQSYQVLVDWLLVSAAQPRPEFLRDLAALMPFILALAGDEAPEAAAGIFQAIQEVCAWWP